MAKILKKKSGLDYTGNENIQSEQIKKSLEDAGFTDIKIHKNKKGWLCVVCKKG